MKLRKIYLMFTVLILFFIVQSCSENTADPSNDFVDHTGEIGIVTDIDGYQYATIGIGGQIWMAENLRVKHYRNGDEILEIADNYIWYNLNETGACCTYNNDPVNNQLYGQLYNWYAAKDQRGLAPEGWHIPSNKEWEIMIEWAGGEDSAGCKLKLNGTELWNPPNEGATNEVGFNALPGGWRTNLGPCFNLGSNGYWWTISNNYMPEGYAYSYGMYSDSTKVESYASLTNFGLSVRCIKDYE